MSQKIDTSRAQEVSVDMYNYDDIPLALDYTIDNVPADLLPYKFLFIVEQNSKELTNYGIDAGEVSNLFLVKDGSVLSMQGLFEDLRNKMLSSVPAKMIMIVTDEEDKTYVHIVYNINANKY